MAHNQIETALNFLGWNVPAAYGVSIPAEIACGNICDRQAQPWDARKRRRFWDSLQSAQERIEARLGGGMVQPEQDSVAVHLDNGECTVQLNRPIAYLGKRIETKLENDYTINYPTPENGACADDYLATVFVPSDDLPSGIAGEHLFVCYTQKYCLWPYDLSQPHCVDYVEDYEGSGQNGYLLTWHKWQLAKPTNGKAACITGTDGFLETVTIGYWQIDETLAIEPVESCVCGGCEQKCESDPTYTFEIKDPECGLICIYSHSCGCGSPADALKIHFGLNYPERIAIKDAQNLLALERMGKTCPCVTCNGFGDPNEYLSTSTEFVGQYDSVKDFPFGSTIAGVKAWRLVCEEIARREAACCELEIIGRKARRKRRNFRNVWKTQGSLNRQLMIA